MPSSRKVALTIGESNTTRNPAPAFDFLARKLASLIEGEVRSARHDRLLYATDASLYQVEPLAVVRPRSINDVEIVVRFCTDRRIPVLPRGAGTSLAGQTVNRAVVIDFSASCNRIIELDPVRRITRVEPGVVLDDLNHAAAPHRLMFGPDVATSAQANIGGMIGNNSAGAHSILYGRTVEHLLGVDAMLADGTRVRFDEGAAIRDPGVRQITQRIADVLRPIESEIDRRFPKIVRHVNGYNLDLILKELRAHTPGHDQFENVNLAHLLCGSEGTLAITVEATLNLVPMPNHVGLTIVAFASVDEALKAVRPILQTAPSAIELIDDTVISLALKNREYRRYVDLLPTPSRGDRGAVLYVEYFADDASMLQAKFDQLRSQFSSRSIQHFTKPSEMAQAWKLRKAGEPLLHALNGPRKPLTFIEDLAVDPSRLAEFIADFRPIVAKHHTTAAYYAHASVGCLHIRPMINLRDESDRAAMQAIAEEATDLVVRYGGALSGEHGDGRARSALLERFYGPQICAAFRQIKSIFDPNNLLNPGNIVDPLPMLDHLRLKPGRHFVEIEPVKTFFRYEREHGFDEAVHMCNGAGVCRKTKGGTMCPSYRATLDERHATRGRGNALRLAIAGQFSSDGVSPSWSDTETRKTLDLCLSCKACKSECPSNVDIAKLKAEYTAQGFASGQRIPLASRAFGNIRWLNQIGSAFHPIANALSRLAPTKLIALRALGLHPNRQLPHFGQSLYRWMRSRSQPALENHSPTVILFPDCFTVYNEPHIGRAAVTTLESLGYRVILPKLGCCGRALISTGQLREASIVCRETALALLNCVRHESAVAVVGCEPSCISAIKDEWLELDMDVELPPLRALAANTFLVEEFIEARWNDHPHSSSLPDADIALPGDSSCVLLHGHCHQKALWGIESSSAILKRLLGNRLTVLDSGCCGMAGSFGYTKDHYDISIRIGELSLFGPIRESPDAIVLAPGTSCRQQIHDGVARDSMHPIELIAAIFAQRSQSLPSATGA